MNRKETIKQHLVYSRETLKEPRQLLRDALAMLKYETNPSLPEGQLRAQVKETLGQLEAFMKTLGCDL